MNSSESTTNNNAENPSNSNNNDTVNVDNTNSDNNSETELTPSEDINPWPYIDSLFKFRGCEGKNCLFICINCPSVSSKQSTISSNSKSNSNLRRHLLRKHPNLLSKFDGLVSEHASSKRHVNKRKRTTHEGEAELVESANIRPSKQPNIHTYMASNSGSGRKVLKKTYENKVRVIVYIFKFKLVSGE